MVNHMLTVVRPETEYVLDIKPGHRCSVVLAELIKLIDSRMDIRTCHLGLVAIAERK